MRLYYIDTDRVVDAGDTHFDEDWYDKWLGLMIDTNNDTIFFLTDETTDVDTSIFHEPWIEWDVDANVPKYTRDWLRYSVMGYKIGGKLYPPEAVEIVLPGGGIAPTYILRED
jgi:hypothetical protein